MRIELDDLKTDALCVAKTIGENYVWLSIEIEVHQQKEVKCYCRAYGEAVGHTAKVGSAEEALTNLLRRSADSASLLFQARCLEDEAKRLRERATAAGEKGGGQ